MESKAARYLLLQAGLPCTKVTNTQTGWLLVEAENIPIGAPALVENVLGGMYSGLRVRYTHYGQGNAVVLASYTGVQS